MYSYSSNNIFSSPLLVVHIIKNEIMNKHLGAVFEPS